MGGHRKICVPDLTRVCKNAGGLGCGSEIHGKTTAGPSTPLAAKSAANCAQDDNFIVMRTSDSLH